MVPNSAILECDTSKSSTEKWFMDMTEDHSAESNEQRQEWFLSVPSHSQDWFSSLKADPLFEESLNQ